MEGQERLLGQKRETSAFQPQSHDSVCYPLPGRSDAHGATGGGRLSWFMADPQGAAQVHLIRKDTDYQHCPPTELLSLQPMLQPSLGGRGEMFGCSS